MPWLIDLSMYLAGSRPPHLLRRNWLAHGEPSVSATVGHRQTALWTDRWQLPASWMDVLLVDALLQ